MGCQKMQGMEESSSGRLRMGDERLARTQDELESALQGDKAETSKGDRGKVNDPALLKPRTGHPNPFSRLTSRPHAQSNTEPLSGFITSGHTFWYDLIWDSCGLNALRCFR